METNEQSVKVELKVLLDQEGVCNVANASSYLYILHKCIV